MKVVLFMKTTDYQLPDDRKPEELYDHHGCALQEIGSCEPFNNTHQPLSISFKASFCLHLTQNGTEDLELAVDTFLENGTWESFDPDSLSGEPILRVRNPQICARVL